MASLTTDVFSLEQVEYFQRTGDWVPKDNIWILNPTLNTYFNLSGQANPNVGYFGFGSIDRIDYSNDTATASPKGSLSSTRTRLAATGNTNYGWFTGGYSPVYYSTVDRINYANDTATASVRGPLAGIRREHAAVGNNSYGWVGGGFGNPGAPTVNNSVERIDYSNDTATASPKGSLSVARYYLSAAGNTSFGWFGGGYAPPYSTVDRIDYSNDTATASVRGPLSTTRAATSATGNSNYGWWGGGGIGLTPQVSVVDRIDYSNDTVTASPRGVLTAPKASSGAAGNSSYGWFGAGTTSPGVGLTTVDRIDFSNDTVTANARGRLNTPATILAATSGASNGLTTYGRLIPKTTIQVKPYGYFGGGYSPSLPAGLRSIVDRVDYSNDTATASPRGSLNSSKQVLSAVSNSFYGYFGGGAGSPATTVVSSIDRVDYNNDTATTSPRGPLSSARGSLGATGNLSYGYFGGGQALAPGPSSLRALIDRVDYSNDTLTTLLKGSLSNNVFQLAAAGNISYGWFGGGYRVPTPSAVVDRIDYSNDTTGAVTRGSLSLARATLGATGNSSYGWFGGGISSRVDRIDYSNDTATASTKGPLTSARTWTSAFGNKSFGYFGGDQTVSTVDRIDYSNDTATASTKGPLSVIRYAMGSSSQTINGFPQ